MPKTVIGFLVSIPVFLAAFLAITGNWLGSGNLLGLTIASVALGIIILFAWNDKSSKLSKRDIIIIGAVAIAFMLLQFVV